MGEFYHCTNGNGFVFGNVFHIGEGLIDEYPPILIESEITYRFFVVVSEILVTDELARYVPLEKELVVIYHQAVIFGFPHIVTCIVIQIGDGEATTVRGTTKWTLRASGIIEHIPLLSTTWVTTRLYQIYSFEQCCFPFIGDRTQHWVVQSVDESAVEEFGEVGTCDGIRQFGGVAPKSIPLSQLVGFYAIGGIGGVLYKECLLPHR